MKGVVLDEIKKKYRFLKDSAADLFGASSKCKIQNYSRFGQTTSHVLEKMPAILDEKNDSEIMLIELGNNDCDKDWPAVIDNPGIPHESNVPFETFKANVKKIIGMIKGAGKQPVVMTLHPIDGDKYFDWITQGDAAKAGRLMQYVGDRNFIYRTQERYAAALEAIAHAMNLPIVPLREKLLGIRKYSDYMCSDGIHLNARGQAAIKECCDERYGEYVNSLN
jgi:lysophospholipase L1-like esterase